MERIEDLSLLSQTMLWGNRRAFEKLVEKHQSSIRRLLLNLTLGDKMLADDLSQETFIRAYLKIRSFQGSANFSTWLYRIACNVFYDYCRKNRNREESLSLVSDTETNFIRDETLCQDCQMDIQGALRILKEEERTIVLLFFMEDQEIKQIAKIMGHPAGTIKSILFRAKQKMREYLEKHDYGTR